MVLNIAIVVFIMIAILFGLCLAVFIKSYVSYRDEENEAAPPKPRKTEKAAPKSEAKDEPNEVSDGFETRVSTKEEVAQLRQAAQKPAPTKPAPPNPRPAEPAPAPIKDEESASGSKTVPIVIAVSAVVAVLCVAALAYGFINARTPSVGGDNSIVSEAVTTEDIILQETVTGKITSPENMTSIFAANGKITDVNVSEGDHVTRGTVIYEIDNSNLKAHIALLNERLAAATAQSSSTPVSVTASRSGTVSEVAVSKGSKVETGDKIAEIYIPAEHSVTVTLSSRVSVGDTVTVNSGSTSVQGIVTSVRELQVSVPEDDDSETEETSRSAWTVTVTFSTSSEVGSTAAVTVGGDRAVGTVSKGRGSTVSVTAKADGSISDLRVKSGDSVSEGDVLAVIETPASASAAESAFNARELQLEIDQLSAQLENYILRAPADGYIQKLFLKKGDNAVLNMSAVTLSSEESLTLEIELDRDAAEKMTLPAAVSFKIQRSGSFPSDVWGQLDTNRVFHATIDNLSPSDSGNRYVGYIALDEQSLFRSGMTAKVSVTTYSAYNAIVVPKELVNGGKVKVLSPSGEVMEVAVETGVETPDGKLEITSGLTRSDRIVTE